MYFLVIIQWASRIGLRLVLFQCHVTNNGIKIPSPPGKIVRDLGYSRNLQDEIEYVFVHVTFSLTRSLDKSLGMLLEGWGLFSFSGCFFKDVKRNKPILISNRISFRENTPH